MLGNVLDGKEVQLACATDYANAHDDRSSVSPPTVRRENHSFAGHWSTQPGPKNRLSLSRTFATNSFLGAYLA